MSYPGYRKQLQFDPAATRKGGWAAGGDPSYPSAVGQFNNWLYTPLDRRTALPPGAPTGAASATQAHADATATGWQSPTAPMATGKYKTPYGTVGIQSGAQYDQAKMAAFGPPGPWNNVTIQNEIPTATATAAPFGPAYPGAPSRTATSTPAGGTGFVSAIDTAPMASMNGAVSPAQNSMQRWQSAAQQPGFKPISDARRFFWATGNIDARAPQSAQNSTPAPVTFQGGDGHSSWTPDSGTNTSPVPVSFANAGTGGHSNWEPGY